MKATFEQLRDISILIDSKNEKKAREELIKILETEDKPYSKLLNHLLREVGLYPYLEYETSSWYDKVICELFKTDIGSGEEKILHREQGAVLKELLSGKDVVLSAPTSFGKSFIIDALMFETSKSIPHDKFSAFIYGLYYIKQDEERRGRRKKFNISDLMFMN